MALELFRRHTTGCLPKLREKRLTHEQIRKYKHCSCPVWYSGCHNGKWYPRASLKVNSWEAGVGEIRRIESGEPGLTTGVPVADAVAKWTTEVKLSGSKRRTVEHYAAMGRWLVEYTSKHHVRLVQHITPDLINQWRTEWAAIPLAPSTHRLRITLLRIIFGYVRRMGWVRESPMDLIAVPKRKRLFSAHHEENATMPLDLEGDANYRAILEAVPAYLAGRIPTGKKSHKRRGVMSTRPAHLVALCHLMYETGLRVSDAVMFDIDRVQMTDGEGIYTTIQIKTGRPVTVFLEPWLVEEIRALPRISPKHVFYDGTTDLNQYIVAKVWKLLREVGDAINVPNVHPHRFRDSFAVNQLNRGLLLEEVSKLLGHASVSMTERYYAPFVKSRQDALRMRWRTTRNGNATAKVVAIRKRRAV